MLATLWLTSEAAQREFSDDSKTEDERLANCYVAFYNLDMTTSGWVRVGQADVEAVQLMTGDSLRRGMVETLDAQIKSVQAEAQRQINYLEDRKQQLLCLEAPK